MTRKDDGGPAFPVSSGLPGMGGMSLRDYFAAHIMAGLCADPTSHELFADAQYAAENAYLMADAMIAESQKP